MQNLDLGLLTIGQNRLEGSRSISVVMEDDKRYQKHADVVEDIGLYLCVLKCIFGGQVELMHINDVPRFQM